MKIKKCFILIIAFSLFMNITPAHVMAAETLTQEEAIALSGTLNDLYPDIMQMFYELNCNVVVDPDISGSTFNTATKSIKLKREDEADFLYCLAYFINLGARSMASTPNFKQIYNYEKANYPGEDKDFAITDQRVYMYCSIRQYFLHKDRLNESCPYTIAAINSALEYFLDSTYAKTLSYIKFYIK